MRKTLLILIALSVAAVAEFSRFANGVVTDTATGLMWQDDYSDNNGTIKSANWSDAIAYCENLTLGGYGDWRLPNIRELNSIVDLTRAGPAIDPIFQATVSGYYWSATTHADYPNSAWGFRFWDGYRGSYNKSGAYYVCCVRLGQ